MLIFGGTFGPADARLQGRRRLEMIRGSSVINQFNLLTSANDEVIDGELRNLYETAVDATCLLEALRLELTRYLNLAAGSSVALTALIDGGWGNSCSEHRIRLSDRLFEYPCSVSPHMSHLRIYWFHIREGENR